MSEEFFEVRNLQRIFDLKIFKRFFKVKNP